MGRCIIVGLGIIISSIWISNTGCMLRYGLNTGLDDLSQQLAYLMY